MPRRSVAPAVAAMLIHRCDGKEEFVRVDQLVRQQVPLGDEPDLAAGIGEDKIALAGFGGVVHPQHFVDQRRIKVSIVNRVRVWCVGGFKRVYLDKQSAVDIHGRSLPCPSQTRQRAIAVRPARSPIFLGRGFALKMRQDC